MRRVDLHAREGEETGFCLMNIPTLELPSLLPYAGTCFAARPKKRAVSAACTPSQNHILAALPAEEYERLRTSRAERFRVYERIKARTKRIAPAKLDRAIEEGVRAARGGR